MPTTTVNGRWISVLVLCLALGAVGGRAAAQGTGEAVVRQAIGDTAETFDLLHFTILEHSTTWERVRDQCAQSAPDVCRAIERLFLARILTVEAWRDRQLDALASLLSRATPEQRAIIGALDLAARDDTNRIDDLVSATGGGLEVSSTHCSKFAVCGAVRHACGGSFKCYDGDGMNCGDGTCFENGLPGCGTCCSDDPDFQC
ncbi:MAG: hypothetical protein H6983_08035 [Ectothiorhodospiraceae bacterium]|nr:hypothetical protein [Chromatiales bacterium]MCP5154097.1 hypothetical protein [Ectothiorhodospiraceae bacterium]